MPVLERQMQSLGHRGLHEAVKAAPSALSHAILGQSFRRIKAWDWHDKRAHLHHAG